MGHAVGLAVRDLSLSPPAPGGLEADRHCARTHGSTDPATATRSRSTRTKSKASVSRSRPSTPRPPRSAQTGRLVLDQQATRAPASHRPGRATKTGRSGGRNPLRVLDLLFCPPSPLVSCFHYATHPHALSNVRQVIVREYDCYEYAMDAVRAGKETTSGWAERGNYDRRWRSMVETWPPSPRETRQYL